MSIESHLARLVLAGFRPRTVQARGDVLHAFARALIVPVDQATRGDVEAWLARPLAPESPSAAIDQSADGYDEVRGCAS